MKNRKNNHGNIRVNRPLEGTLFFSETNVVTTFKINSYFRTKNTFVMILTSVSNVPVIIS